jgi:pseudouridine-5'-phosphate glycosidase
MDPKVINKAINEAIKDMDELGVKGKEETPFLLSKIVELTGGKSLEANVRLVRNNALVGSLIAKAYFDKKENE